MNYFIILFIVSVLTMLNPHRVFSADSCAELFIGEIRSQDQLSLLNSQVLLIETISLARSFFSGRLYGGHKKWGLPFLGSIIEDVRELRTAGIQINDDVLNDYIAARNELRDLMVEIIEGIEEVSNYYEVIEGFDDSEIQGHIVDINNRIENIKRKIMYIDRQFQVLAQKMAIIERAAHKFWGLGFSRNSLDAKAYLRRLRESVQLQIPNLFDALASGNRTLIIRYMAELFYLDPFTFRDSQGQTILDYVRGRHEVDEILQIFSLLRPGFG